MDIPLKTIPAPDLRIKVEVVNAGGKKEPERKYLDENYSKEFLTSYFKKINS